MLTLHILDNYISPITVRWTVITVVMIHKNHALLFCEWLEYNMGCSVWSIGIRGSNYSSLQGFQHWLCNVFEQLIGTWPENTMMIFYNLETIEKRQTTYDWSIIYSVKFNWINHWVSDLIFCVRSIILIFKVNLKKCSYSFHSAFQIVLWNNVWRYTYPVRLFFLLVNLWVIFVCTHI